MACEEGGGVEVGKRENQKGRLLECWQTNLWLVFAVEGRRGCS